LNTLQISDPEAVPLPEDEYEDAPERPGRAGVYEPSAEAGRERRASEESAGTAEEAFM
jgi:hypothetical protein